MSKIRSFRCSLLLTAIASASCLAVLRVPQVAHADLISTFNSDAEGWTGLDPSTGDWTANWQASGGNPGGYLRGIETNSVGGTGYFIAPSSWGGNWSSYVGGTLSFDEVVLQGTSYFAEPNGDVQIYSGSSYVKWNSPDSLYSSAWQNHQVVLSPANFTAGTAGADFNTIMSNVTGLWIRGELISGPEQEGLDNVMVSAVPEPSTLVLVGVAAIGLAACSWRRRRS